MTKFHRERKVADKAYMHFTFPSTCIYIGGMYVFRCTYIYVHMHIYIWIYILCLFFANFSNQLWSFTGGWVTRTANPQISFQYPCRFQQCCDLDAFNYSSNLQFTQSLFHVLGTILRIPTINCYQSHLHVRQLFSVLWQGPGVFSSLSASFNFVCSNCKIHLIASSFLLAN